MNESEQDRLQILVKDEFLLTIVEKLFFSVIEKNKPIITEEIGDKILGEKYRAYSECKKTVAKCFDELREQRRGDKNEHPVQFSRGR